MGAWIVVHKAGSDWIEQMPCLRFLSYTSVLDYKMLFVIFLYSLLVCQGPGNCFM